MNYATDIIARREMIWCALSSFGRNIKDPIAYRNRKIKKFGPILTEAIGAAYPVMNDGKSCLAVCEDKVDEALSAKYGWTTIAAIREADLAALRARVA